MVFRSAKLLTQFTYLAIIFSMLVQSGQGLFLLFLYLQKRFWFFLQLLQNPFFVLLFIFQSDYFLDVVWSFKLTSHAFNLFFIELNLVLWLLELSFFGKNLFILFLTGQSISWGLFLFLCSWLVNKLFQLASEHLQLTFETLILLSHFTDNDLFVIAKSNTTTVLIRRYSDTFYLCSIHLSELLIFYHSEESIFLI